MVMLILLMIIERVRTMHTQWTDTKIVMLKKKKLYLQLNFVGLTNYLGFSAPYQPLGCIWEIMMHKSAPLS